MSRKAGIRAMQMDEGINLTPLLDVLFNLIFFFILATTIKEREAFLDVNLPEASAGADQGEARETWTVVLTSDQRLFLNGEEIDAAALETRLREAPDNAIEGIVVRGDIKAYHGTLVQALDACARAGRTRIRIEVSPASAE